MLLQSPPRHTRSPDPEPDLGNIFSKRSGRFFAHPAGGLFFVANVNQAVQKRPCGQYDRSRADHLTIGKAYSCNPSLFYYQLRDLTGADRKIGELEKAMNRLHSRD